MVQSVKRPLLDLDSGHDLAVPEIKLSVVLCPDRVEPAWDSLSPSAPPPCYACACSLSLSLSLSLKKRKI